MPAVAELALVSILVAPDAAVVVVLPMLEPAAPADVPEIPGVLVVSVTALIPVVDDIELLPLICIGGHGVIAVVLPFVVCCAVAAAATAAVSASERLVARHRAIRSVASRSVDIDSSWRSQSVFTPP